MIDIRQDGSYIKFHIDTGVGYTIEPSFNTGDGLYARLLRDQLSNKLFHLIQKIREEAYLQGWSDKSKHRRKATYFPGPLKTGLSAS